MPTPAPDRTRLGRTHSAPLPPPPAPPRPDGLAAVNRRRNPTAAPLYPMVQDHLETFLVDTAARAQFSRLRSVSGIQYSR
jgi:hypothetical protein